MRGHTVAYARGGIRRGRIASRPEPREPGQDRDEARGCADPGEQPPLGWRAGAGSTSPDLRRPRPSTGLSLRAVASLPDTANRPPRTRWEDQT